MKRGLFFAFALVACASNSTSTQDAGPDSSVVDGAKPDVADDTGTIDAASDASVDVEAGPSWSPADLGSSVVLWLAGDDKVTLTATKNPNVAAWGDKSSWGNSAMKENGVGAPSVNVTLLNGHKTIHFIIGELLAIPDSTSLQFGTGGFTVAAVVAYINPVDASVPAASPDFFVKQSTQSPYGGIAVRGNNVGTSTFLGYVQPNNTVQSAAGMNTGAFHYLVLRRTTSTSLDLHVDGLSTTANITSTDVSAVGYGATIGALSLTAECLNGDIAELVVVNNSLTDADTAQIESYFETKYAL